MSARVPAHHHLLLEAVARASRWKLLLLTGFLAALPAVVPAVGVGALFGAPLSSHPSGDKSIYTLDTDTFIEVLRASELSGLGPTVQIAMLVALLFAFFASPLTSALTLSQVTHAKSRSFGELVQGAAGFFWRMCRIAAVAVIPLAVTGGIAAALNHWQSKYALTATTETASNTWLNVTIAASVLLVGGAFLNLEAARAVLAANPRRRSAFVSLFSGLKLLIRWPIRGALLAALSFVFGLLLALLLTRVRSSVQSLWATVLLSSLAAATIAWGRSVRMALLVAVAKLDAQRLTQAVTARMLPPTLKENPPEPQSRCARSVSEDVRAQARAQFGLLLELAYSGEQGAATAYAGHAHALGSAPEAAQIRRIFRDEVDHRRCILQILRELGLTPSVRREKKLKRVGTAISMFCHAGSWFFPMYGAGRLEAQNIAEYELAAQLATLAGLEHYVDRMLTLAEVEWDHAQFFRAQCEKHWLWKLAPKWPALATRESIRAQHFEFSQNLAPTTLEPLHVPLVIR
jgi:hypothetical protein